MYNIVIVYHVDDAITLATFRNVIMAHADIAFIRVDDVYCKANNLPDNNIHTIFALTDAIGELSYLLKNFRLGARSDVFTLLVNNRAFTYTQIEEGELDEFIGAAPG